MTSLLSQWFSGSGSNGPSGLFSTMATHSHHDQQQQLIAARQLQSSKKRKDEEEDETKDVVDVDVDDEVEVVAEKGLEDDLNESANANDETEKANDDDESEEANEEAEKTRMDLVKLVPFDVKLSLTSSSEQSELNTFALTDLVTDWLDESLAAEIKRMELGLSHSTFASVVLEQRSIQHKQNRKLRGQQGQQQQQEERQVQESETSTKITTATYEGVSLWRHPAYSDKKTVTTSLLEDLERRALLQDDRLLDMLQASTAKGLGDSVADVRAYINPNPTDATTSAAATAGDSNKNSNLELIIVVAIAVACMAFLFLVFSLFWAWRFDQQRRQDAYRVETNTSPQKANTKQRKPTSPDGTGGTDKSDDDDSKRSPPQLVVAVERQHEDDDTAFPASETNPTTGPSYPESVISDDISTSLTAYYRSGMGSRPIYASNRAMAPADDFNDQASFSSMESYGYSLDGYAPSLAGNTYARPSASGQEQQDQRK